jgi:hypothetical protein
MKANKMMRGEGRERKEREGKGRKERIDIGMEENIQRKYRGWVDADRYVTSEH